MKISPVKYPLMFNSSQTLLINKIDLLPYLDFDMDELSENIKRTNPIRIFKVSGKAGEGMDGFKCFEKTHKSQRLVNENNIATSFLLHQVKCTIFLCYLGLSSWSFYFIYGE